MKNILEDEWAEWAANRVMSDSDNVAMDAAIEAGWRPPKPRTEQPIARYVIKYEPEDLYWCQSNEWLNSEATARFYTKEKNAKVCINKALWNFDYDSKYLERGIDMIFPRSQEVIDMQSEVNELIKLNTVVIKKMI